METLYTRAEAAERLRISEKTLSRLPIPTVRHTPRGKVFYEEKDLVEWLARRKVGSSSGGEESPTSGSPGPVSVSMNPRARQILSELQKKPRRSTRTSSPAAA